MLLSLASSPGGIMSAQQNGADAVCFSVSPTVPRSGALSMQEARAIPAYCLPRGAKSFLYINQHPTDKELGEWAVCVAELASLGLSGVMLRDIGVLKMVKQVCPEMETHVAPSADVLTIKLARLWHSLGASMVWLPPYMSRERLAYILLNSHVQCGVTVAGQMCALLPGQCFLTPGNRGACTSECRRPYGVNEKPASLPLEPLDFSKADQWEDYEIMGANNFCVFEPSDRSAEYTREWRGIIDGGNPKPRLVEVKFSCLIQAGQPVKVAVQDSEGRVIRVQGQRPSRSPAGVIEAAVNTQFYKLAGTYYSCAQARSHIESGLTVPLTSIVELRKTALELLTKERSNPPKRAVGAFHAGVRYLTRPEPPEITIWVRSMSQLSARLADLKPELLYVPIMELADDGGKVLNFLERGVPVCAWIPRGLGDDEQQELHTALGQAQSMGIKEISAPCPGYLDILQKCGFAVRCEPCMGVVNTQTLKELKRLGIKSALLSHELTLSAVKELSHVIDTELQAYGRLPMGFSEHCMMKSPKGMCSCDNINELVDTSGARAPILKEYKCRTGIYSPSKLFWGDRTAELNNIGLWAIRLTFITENALECVSVTERYMGLGLYTPGEYTRGMLEKL